ncbi:site-specific integrase [Cellulomonas fimi]|nr:site-specific integrase [Cellulomonas fimi]
MLDRWHTTRAGEKVRSPRYGKGKRWQARWEDPTTRRERTAAFERKPDAERHVVAMESAKARGVYIDPAAGRITVAQFAAQWQAAQPYGPSSATQRDVHLRRHILPTLGHQPLAAVTPSMVKAWLRGLTGSEASKRQQLKTLNQMLGAAVDDGVIPRNPAAARSVTKPKAVPQDVVPWTTEQADAVADALPERYRVLVTLAWGLGLRSGELFGLAVEDVDFLRHTVTVRRQVRLDNARQVLALPKFEHVRQVPLPTTVADELAAYLQRYPAREVTLPWASREAAQDGKPHTVRLVVTTREGGALNRNYVSAKVWRPALAAAGLATTRGNGMHALRHTYASVLLDGGLSIRAVAEYLGHTDPAFTLRVYSHLMPTAEGSARSAVDAALASRKRLPDQRLTGTSGPVRSRSS